MKVLISHGQEKSEPSLFKSRRHYILLYMQNGMYLILDAADKSKILSIVDVDPDDLEEFNGSITLSND